MWFRTCDCHWFKTSTQNSIKFFWSGTYSENCLFGFKNWTVFRDSLTVLTGPFCNHSVLKNSLRCSAYSKPVTNSCPSSLRAASFIFSTFASEIPLIAASLFDVHIRSPYWGYRPWIYGLSVHFVASWPWRTPDLWLYWSQHFWLFQYRPYWSHAETVSPMLLSWHQFNNDVCVEKYPQFVTRNPWTSSVLGRNCSCESCVDTESPNGRLW